jgi:hypothetical protein
LWHSQTGDFGDLPNQAFWSSKFGVAASADCKVNFDVSAPRRVLLNIGLSLSRLAHLV